MAGDLLILTRQIKQNESPLPRVLTTKTPRREEKLFSFYFVPWCLDG
jgi:hypothetical protein